MWAKESELKYGNPSDALMTKRPYLSHLSFQLRIALCGSQKMNVLLLLSLLLFIPFFLFLGFLALSSCMGDRFRARVSGITLNPRHTSFGRSYAQGLGLGAGQAGWIEMDETLGKDDDNSDED